MKKVIALLLSLFVLTSCSSAAPSSGSKPQSSSSTPQSVSEPAIETSSIVSEVVAIKETIQFHDVSFDVEGVYTFEELDESGISVVWDDRAVLIVQNLLGITEAEIAAGRSLKDVHSQAHTSYIDSFEAIGVNTVFVQLGEREAQVSTFIGETESDAGTFVVWTLADEKDLYVFVYSLPSDSQADVNRVENLIESTRWDMTELQRDEPVVETIAPTMGESNALSKAYDYLDLMAFSYIGLIEQLKYEGYSTDEATYAVDNCGADWNTQAALKAQNYLDLMSFSRQGLIDQLLYEGFTPEQAEYGVSAVGY